MSGEDEGTSDRMIKILLVDDSKFLRLAAERALARAGYSVCSAADGEQGLALARERLPDLILLDMLLPKMAGLDVLKALRKDPARRRRFRWSRSRDCRTRTQPGCTTTEHSASWRNPNLASTKAAPRCWRQSQRLSRGFPGYGPKAPQRRSPDRAVKSVSRARFV
ncbi:MAG: response regulator [Acidobacteriia bacterium]|nr:response regulator [Terriglobia bacterium]